MIAPGYPFSAIVGQPDLKLALLLGSVDWRLSVLLKGDKGSGKSTAARALADLLPAGAPFVNLPIGTTEDRLLGGLDLDLALQGQAKLKRGLIQEANSGVLYIDEVNLLSDSLTDALLDVASSGRHLVERDGFSASTEAKFIFLGSMNIEEGSLRPQLLDRFAMALDVEAPANPEDRAGIVEARLRYDADPAAFCAAYEEEQEGLRRVIVEARALSGAVQTTSEIVRQISRAVIAAGVRSMRADLAALRAAMAHAALDRRTDVCEKDVEAVLPLVLHHRSKRHGDRPPTPPPDGKKSRDETRDEPAEERAAKDYIFPPEPRQAQKLRVNLVDSTSRGQTATVRSGANLHRPGAGVNGDKVDVVASLTESFRKSGGATLKRENLVFCSSTPASGVRFIFVVDASGSHAAQRRMRAVKGAVAALLESSVDRKDEVAVVSFRGAKAEIVLHPCRDTEGALRVLEFLPTGGRTPLAHALALAGSLVSSASIVVLLTDGRANVPFNSDDPWADALDAARNLRCPAVLVDSSIQRSATDAMDALALAMRATIIRLDEMNEGELMSVLREEARS